MLRVRLQQELLLLTSRSRIFATTVTQCTQALLGLKGGVAMAAAAATAGTALPAAVNVVRPGSGLIRPAWHLADLHLGPCVCLAGIPEAERLALLP